MTKVEKMNARAWAQVKAAENHFVYQLLAMRCHVILTFRAKEKNKIVKRGPEKGQWQDLGWRPIMSDRISFETMFTLMFPPYAKGVPDLSISDMREPFDTMIPAGKPVDEALGQRLAAWASGTPVAKPDLMLHGMRVVLDANAPAGGMTITVPDWTTPDPEAWMAALRETKTHEQRVAVWTVLTVGDSAPWKHLKAPDQKRLLDANQRTKERVGG